MKKILRLLLLLFVIFGLYGILKPVHPDFNMVGNVYTIPADNIQFLTDTTYTDDNGTRVSEQEIFDEIFSMIDEADSYILIDMFLFNDFLGTATTSFRSISQELTDALIGKKKSNPDIVIQFITDPINEIYGGYVSEQLESLKENGINVIITDLTALRDSNPLYSAIWRPVFRLFGNSSNEGILPNPFESSGQKLSVRTYLSLLNFKANHRKVVLTDSQLNGRDTYSILTTSANPHDGSAAHTNIAVRIDDFIWQDVIVSESAVAKVSDYDFIKPTNTTLGEIGDVSVQLITDRAIRDKIITQIQSLQKEDTLAIAMFYIADRGVVKALKQADSRGAKIRLLLDPNKDAFGREKGGVPNRQTASELIQNSRGNTEIRWCNTSGEQCHSKLLLFEIDGVHSLIQGSANLTRRNLKGLNLETNVFISSTKMVPVISDAYGYFEKVWTNEPGKSYSVEYEVYEDNSKLKKYQAWFMEVTGMSSF